MEELGVLDRCLLVYEEVIRRALAKQEISPQVFHQTADLVRRFVEEDEHKVLGEAGFEKCVAEVEALEKRLGIYELAQFTAKG
jgi:hypothetical protein